MRSGLDNKTAAGLEILPRLDPTGADSSNSTPVRMTILESMRHGRRRNFLANS